MLPRTRFAPSPTGLLHVGGVRTALFNRLFTKHSGGVFVLRVEDTDTSRSSREYEKAIMRDLAWLGLEWDEGPDKEGPFGPYRQSERLNIHLDYSKKLLNDGSAYYCYCSRERLEELKASRLKKSLPPRYDGRCRNGKPEGDTGNAAAIRFKVPDGKIEFEDMVHGRLSFEGAGMGDFMIIGSDNVATYNFAAAIDDSLMKITHVIRGDDHLSNTPRQIMILKALGLEPPFYGHLPLVLSKDKTPLSKRDAALSVAALRENGYLKEAILNSVARLGWSPGLHGVKTAPVKDLLTLNEMEILFNASSLSKSPSIFDEESLKKYNRDAIAFASPESLYALIAPEFKDMPEEKLTHAISLAKNGAETTIEITARIKAILKKPAFDENVCLLLGEERSKKILATLATEVLKTENMDEASWKTVLEGLKKTGEKGKALFMPIRAALTGSTEGMEIENIARILGRDEILKRIKDGEHACP